MARLSLLSLILSRHREAFLKFENLKTMLEISNVIPNMSKPFYGKTSEEIEQPFISPDSQVVDVLFCHKSKTSIVRANCCERLASVGTDRSCSPLLSAQPEARAPLRHARAQMHSVARAGCATVISVSYG
ncbi:hypothetical protein BaRGS_00019981 [Batillaria attramentaria]|uniref:Uncharacterized protein n=1 Tax=Batillaria attramentaria TaxID=370345 RepID=A0ABD0KNP3_9CAEN